MSPLDLVGAASLALMLGGLAWLLWRSASDRRWKGRTCTAGVPRGAYRGQTVAQLGMGNAVRFAPCGEPAAWSSPDTGDLCPAHKRRWLRTRKDLAA